MKNGYNNKRSLNFLFLFFLLSCAYGRYTMLYGESTTFCSSDKRIGELISNAAEKMVKIGGSNYQATRPREATQYISQYLLSTYPPSDSFITHKYTEKGQKEFENTIKKLDSLIDCSSEYIRSKNKKYIEELRIIQTAYEFFKKTVTDARINYQQSRLLFSQYIKNNDIYPTIHEHLKELVSNIKKLEPQLNALELKKEVGNQSLSQIFPNYELFFKEYNQIKTKFESQFTHKISPDEIFYLLISIGILKVDTATLKKIKEVGVCNKEIDKLISLFVDKLEKFSFRLDKSWFVLNKKLMQKDALEIIYALRGMCPVLFLREYSTISELKDYSLVFIGDASLALYEWLRMLKNNLLDLEKN